MTNLSHAATGALVAVAIHNPWIGLPAAFASHFVLDAIPHWDVFPNNFMLRRAALAVDITLTLWMLIILALSVDAPRKLVIGGGVLGVLPDLMWAPYFITGKMSKTDKKTPLHLARRFHFWIQIKEFSRGFYIEISWLVLMLVLLYNIHR
jgi:hypothetical protein